MIYLGYVAGGVCRDTHAPTKDEEGNATRPPMVRKQFWVQEELRRLGITAWVGKRDERCAKITITSDTSADLRCFHCRHEEEIRA